MSKKAPHAEWDEYVNDLASRKTDDDKPLVNRDFIDHITRVHDSLGTAIRIVESQFGASLDDGVRLDNRHTVLTVTQWILSGPPPWEG